MNYFLAEALTTAVNAAGSLTASSDKILRSRLMFAAFSEAINLL
jgi:hypothetical protein